MKNILIVCAMEKESSCIAGVLKLNKVEQNIWKRDNINLLVTGVGKQRTAISLTDYFNKHEKVDLIINIGYAGSTDIPIGRWVCISKVHNYEWEIPGEEKYDFIDFGNKELKKVTNKNIDIVECYSSESFVTNTNLTGHIAFDMELHSVVVIADMLNMPVMSVKKISDNLCLDDYYTNTENNANVFELDSCLNFLLLDNDCIDTE